MKNIEMPDWLEEEPAYQPVSGRNTFIEKSKIQFLFVLSKLKMQVSLTQKELPAVGLSIFVLLEVIFFIVSSRKILLLFCFLGIELVYLATFSGKVIKVILLEMFSGAAFAFVFSLPAYIMGNHYTMQMLVLKTILTVLAVALFSHTIPFYRLGQSLGRIKGFHTIVFIFDITMKYLTILGRICTQMTEAVSLRFIGKNNRKQKTAAGILGMTYLKSQHMTKEMYQAMTCRGFDGTYHTYKRHTFNWRDGVLFVFAIGMFVVSVMF